MLRKESLQTKQMAENDHDGRLPLMLGLCQRAGRLKSGEFSAEASIKDRKCRLCILASDASENTKKKFSDMCAYRAVRLLCADMDKEALGRAIGKKERAVVAICDEGFGSRIAELINGGNVNE